jgi:hypothetical protein
VEQDGGEEQRGDDASGEDVEDVVIAHGAAYQWECGGVLRAVVNAGDWEWKQRGDPDLRGLRSGVGRPT